MIDTGFVNFPFNQPHISIVENGKTFCYLVALDVEYDKETSFVNIDFPTLVAIDDISPKDQYKLEDKNIDEIVDMFKSQEKMKLDDKLVSAILIGSIEMIFNQRNSPNPWSCTFGSLTNEGKKLYYSLKKLHYDKEIKILTLTRI
jgi:hypothetical protein